MQTTTEDPLFWLALARVPHLEPRLLCALVRRFGGAEGVFRAGPAALGEILPTQTAARRAISRGPDRRAAQPDLDWLAGPRHCLVRLFDEHYPALLREITDPPIVLFVNGDPATLAGLQVAVVGSRNPTPAGREIAHHFGVELARRGLVVTSGLALGIDAAAHRGALAGGGASIAVTGCGPERVYPTHHRRLAAQIAEAGAVVSEFPVGRPPRRDHFPRRNRIISGLCTATVVVEAAMRSGSLITARLAGEQGREVLAVPGSIHSPQSRGCHRLLRQGAKLTEGVDDILEEIGPLAAVALPAAERVQARSANSPLLHWMGPDPVSVDTLVRRSGLTAESVSSMLLAMELDGLVETCPGGTYIRTVRSSLTLPTS